MHLIERASPNHDDRPAPGIVDMLVLHYTGMTSAAAAIDRLCSPEARVSAHYLIEEDGTAWRLVDEHRRAWHAGLSSWAGARQVNGVSIGIELVNPGHEHGYRGFPEPQMAALEALCREILGRHPIPPSRVLGHADVAPQRKSDPGERFDWARLARAGIGRWPDLARTPRALPGDGAALQLVLARIGYEIPATDRGATGPLDEAARNVVIAFQRHFRPERCDGEADEETRRRAALVAEMP